MENGPFIDDFPINTSIYKGFSMAMLNNQMVYVLASYLRQMGHGKMAVGGGTIHPNWSPKRQEGSRDVIAEGAFWTPKWWLLSEGWKGDAT
jgi:hypothetical protein